MAPRRLLVCCVMVYPSNKVMVMGPWFNINVWFTESCLVRLQGKGYDNLIEFNSNDTFSELLLIPPKKPVKDKQLLVLKKPD